MLIRTLRVCDTFSGFLVLTILQPALEGLDSKELTKIVFFLQLTNTKEMKNIIEIQVFTQIDTRGQFPDYTSSRELSTEDEIGDRKDEERRPGWETWIKSERHGTSGEQKFEETKSLSQ